MYTFNSHLFTSLPKLLGYTRTAISLRLGLNKCVLVRVTKPENCHVKLLVDICNSFHLDIRKFFVKDDEVPEYNIAPIDDEYWSPVVIKDVDMSQFKSRKDVFTCFQLICAMNCGYVELSDVLQQDLKAPVVNETNCNISKEMQSEYLFNVDLFRIMPRLLDINETSIGKSVGRSVRLYDSVMKHRDIRVQTLVDICNFYRIPIRLFFRKSSDSIPKDIVDATMSDVSFYPYRISEFYGRGRKYTYAGIKELLGFTNPRFLRAMSERSPLTATELIFISQKIGVTPDFFFQDPISRLSEEEASSIQKTIEQLRFNSEQKRIETQLLKSRIRHLEAMLDR